MHFSGTVIHGEKIGRTLGYPTANIAVEKENVSYSSGVYAAWVYYEGKKYQGALVILEEPWKVEVYIINMEPKDIYGVTLDIDIIARISDIVAYTTVDALKHKIAHDVDMAKQLLV